jgi:malate permease and related proteins
MPLSFVLAGDLGSNLAEAMSTQKLWINIAKTIIFILLGFIFTKKKLLPENTGKILTKFVMAVCIPCLAFCSFMSKFTVNGAIDAVFNFIFGFVLYILFIFVGKLLFLWVPDKKKRVVLGVLFAFGSTTFFAYPLISSIFGKDAGNNFNVMNVAYRVFLYSYAYVTVANLEDDKVDASLKDSDGNVAPAKTKTDIGSILKKALLNPIVIATFAGLILWLLQAIPGTAIVPSNWIDSTVTDTTKVAFWRIDVTLPWIYQAANTLGGLSSTIILFAIGCTLGGTNIKEAVEDKYAWIWTALKVIVAPVIVLGLLFVIQLVANATGLLKDSGETVSKLVSMNTVNSAVITWMVPPATVAVGYCINFDKEKEMASHISLVSTIGAIVGTVIWVIVLTVVNATGIFYVAA